ncbi:hypothetical protein BDW74DRAFT_170209 [Aspergillus multicolor]|uniref:SET domain protein n=1 Tax=Aspergillus multicolor TaxID=41759 RepID=UPI003CCCFA65
MAELREILRPNSYASPSNRKRSRVEVDTDTETEYDGCDFKKRRASLQTYPEHLQKQVTQLATDIVASIYFDINYLCVIRTSIKIEKTDKHVKFYRLQYSDSVELLDMLVGSTIEPKKYEAADHRGTLQRMREFVSMFSWKMLAICLTTEGFRRAVREIKHGGIWVVIMEKIKDNEWSIEVYARSRNLDWRGQLLKYAYLGVTERDAELRFFRKMWAQHPHHTVQGLNRQIRRLWYENQQQVHINECIFNPDSDLWKATGRRTDPSLRRPEDGKCDLCGSKTLCDCKLDFPAGSLFELVERPKTGTGVRALYAFKRRDILGQFVGEIQPPDYEGDEVYALSLVSKINLDKALAVISPKQYGNWTRYIAHSCNASCEFVPRTIGKYIVMTVEALADIAAGEDITVNYGMEYWADKKYACECGEWNCFSKEQSEEEEEEVIEHHPRISAADPASAVTPGLLSSLLSALLLSRF